jgi:hypothetical protein
LTTGTSSKQQGGSLADAFPALPAAPKPTTTIFSPGYSGAGLRRDNSGRNMATNNAWGAGAGPNDNGDGNSMAAAAAAAAEEGSGAGGKKKGNKNKKQTLFHFG